jgi:hypothetical protein
MEFPRDAADFGIRGEIKTNCVVLDGTGKATGSGDRLHRLPLAPFWRHE